MNSPLSLHTIPQEILEHIAYLVATEPFHGPPASLIPLLLTNRHINASLSLITNHHLYARIFSSKFDTRAPLARLGADKLTAHALAAELRRRCVVLQRIRARIDSTTHARHAEAFADDNAERLTLYDVLTTAYFMLLENDGRNRRQLVEYAMVKGWIQEFWFDAHGSSLAMYNLRIGRWPMNCTEASLGMWIFWLVFSMDDDITPRDTAAHPLHVMKPMALGAHLYNLTSTPWTQFHKGAESKPSKATHFSYEVNINPTPLAAPAILSFMALHNKNRSILIPPSDAPPQASSEWDAEWNRSVEGSTGRTFRPGSAEGVWQGFFTFTDFTGYGLILGGAPPGVIQGSAMGRHQHTWKLREHYLVGAATPDDDSGVDLTLDNDDSDKTPSSSLSKPQPLPAGDPLRSFFPTGTQLVERDEGVTVRDSRTGKVYEYVRRPPGVAAGRDLPAVKDVIITGEGHSAWGQFNLVGRVRPRDGLITVSKDYVDGDRGKWLYRGYLIGDAAGNISGRWRDTISPADATGYEGCFYMSRRR